MIFDVKQGILRKRVVVGRVNIYLGTSRCPKPRIFFLKMLGLISVLVAIIV